MESDCLLSEMNTMWKKNWDLENLGGRFIFPGDAFVCYITTSPPETPLWLLIFLIFCNKILWHGDAAFLLFFPIANALFASTCCCLCVCLIFILSWMRETGIRAGEGSVRGINLEHRATLFVLLRGLRWHFGGTVSPFSNRCCNAVQRKRRGRTLFS